MFGWPIVGVVDDTDVGSRSGGFGLGPAQVPHLYLSWGVNPYPFADLIVRTVSEDPIQQLPFVRDVLAQFAPTVPLQRAGPLDEAIRESTWAFSLFGAVFSVFGGVTVLMATVGLFNVMAFGVRQRTREMGVRMVLGAGIGGILRLVARFAAGQVLAGLGLILSAFLGRSLRLLLFDVAETDLRVHGIVVAILLLAGALAGLGPALTAVRVDPVRALRVE